ncbi:unnamed protein product [Spirodela intermedia]|uniref:EF-hand domain-containing protein n=1 Tax=Spirodela intermedia TaxID=51605 RepID=A0A7I8L902_SPIIN|nr:unnamed protein product [Spirodela intermedia]
MQDPLESFFNSMRAAECGFRRAVKDVEFQWRAPRRGGHRVGFFSQRKEVPQLAEEAEQGWDMTVPAEEVTGKWSLAVFSAPIESLPWRNVRRSEETKRAPTRGDVSGEDSGWCSFCVELPAALSFFLDGFQLPRKHVRKRSAMEDGHRHHLGLRANGEGSDGKCSVDNRHKRKPVTPGFLTSWLLENLLRKLYMLDQNIQDGGAKPSGTPASSEPLPDDHLKIITGIIERKKSDVGGFLSHMSFARVGGLPATLAGFTVPIKGVARHHPSNSGRDEPETNSVQKLTRELLSIPLSNVERWLSTVSTVSLAGLVEFLPQLRRSSREHPDKKKLISVQDFFRYTETEGRRFFEELDRDGDGQVTLEDLEIAMRKRRLPQKYAREFLRQTRSHMFSKSIKWKQFLSLLEQEEATILRAYTTLCLSKSGTLEKSQIMTTLKSAGLPANEDSAVAMMRYLNPDTHGSISYSHFRNFMLLLPSERLEDDPRNVWFEAATVVSVPPPMAIRAESVLKSALAGGLASALSTSLLYPVDTMKTRVQASTLSFPELVSRLPQIGLRGLYRGSVPAILGQFSSHGLRTGILEASKLLLINVAPSLPEIQVQSLASFGSTVLGTAVRIPCEVLKQRLQAGLFDNAGEAILGTLHRDGLGGFFRGTTATLCREVPFYVAGVGFYTEAKKATQKMLERELEPWETIALGALSGGLAAVVTTPFDVMKTKMMTAPEGLPLSMSAVALAVLRHEGPLGLFKGAVPRFFWIAPLGAMNFAGYELARKAMDKS